MTKIKLRRRQIVFLLSGIFIISVVGLTIYELQELRGLRARVHTIEYNGNEAQNQLDAQDLAYQNEKVDYEVISKTTADVRVQDTESYNENNEEPKYETKKVYIYKMKVTNNTTFAYEYAEGDVKGKTKSGSLISPVAAYSIHPADRRGKDSLNLAPKGSAVVYVYIPADEEIVELYYSRTDI